MQKEIQKVIIEDIAKKKVKSHYLIGGDFNRILNTELDTTNTDTHRERKQLPLVKWMSSLGFGETFRICNPRIKKYTWSNGSTQTRIDQIWISSKLKEGLNNSDIEDMDLITGSDHNLIWGEINTSLVIETSTKNLSRANERNIPRRRIYQYQEATVEDWENYRAKLDNILTQGTKRTGEMSSLVHEEKEITEANINEEWDRIVNAINRAAAKHIPFKLSKRTIDEKDKQVLRNPRFKDVKNLKRIAKKVKEGVLLKVDETDRFLWNCQIQEINNRQNTQIRELSELSDREWVLDTKTWIRIMEKNIQREDQEKKEKRIIENIEKRYGMIGRTDKQMLDSILERPWKSILIEKILTGAESMVENRELVTDPEKVKEEVNSHFQKQFQKRKHKFEHMNKEWKEEYTPKSWIKKEWYEKVTAEIGLEEWEESLSTAKSNTAPGISGISYTLIRKVGSVASKIFLRLINAIVKTCIFPKKWKVGQIFPIPKIAEWDLSLGSTRPIMLLETFRKSLVRIVQKRMSKVLVEHNILRGLNYAGLPGESTNSPIHIINNLMEDAKCKHKETWILLQDIKKAFDSVSMESIRQSLYRIKAPEVLVNFIIEIFDGRRVQVLTKYGVTNSFQAEDGIDQGEVISPLIWRIIYDPLLVRLQMLKRGYEISTAWPNLAGDSEREELKYQVAAVAYADDTTFIASSKQNLQLIINKAQEFYNLNDIEINPKKSELLVINRVEKNDDFWVELGHRKEVVKAKKIKETVRLLGVWIGGGIQKRKCRNRLQQEVRSFVQILKSKKISVEQIKYLNNRVLLPRLEYKSMIYLWSKQVCDRIHQPMIRLAKWKSDLASTCSNALIVHEDLLGVRSFWQRHTEHMISEWLIRINDSNLLGQTCHLRLREAQLEICDPDPIWEINVDKLIYKAFSNNLSMNILVTAKSLGFTVHTEYATRDWCFSEQKNRETKIISLLQESNWKGSLKSLKNMKIWYLGQLIDTRGKTLFTWQQLRKLLGLSAAGKKAGWFKRIELLVLELSTRRGIRETFLRKSYNTLTTEIQLKRVSTKRSQREWVLSEGKKENEYIVGKVEKKRKVTSEIRPWLKIDNNRSNINLDQEVRLQPVENSSVIKVKNSAAFNISDWIRTKEYEKVLSMQTYHITDRIDRRKGKDTTKKRDRIVPSVRIESWDRVFIQKVIQSEGKKQELLAALEENSRKDDFKFYTDGSLIRGENGSSSRLGYGVVQVDSQGRVIRDIRVH
jgi:hypothetical protein